MKTEDIAASDDDDSLLAQLKGTNGATVRDEAIAALDKLQQELQMRERQGVPPQQSRHLSAALLAVNSARATLKQIKVGTPSTKN